MPTNGNSDASVAHADQHRVVDAAAGVGERPEDQRHPDDEQHEDQDVDRRVDAVVVDAEDAESQHAHRDRVPGGLQEHPAEEVAEREEDEDNERHDHGHERHHLQHAGAAGVHSADALRRPGSDSRSATR